MFYGFLIMETNNKDVKPHCSGGKKTLIDGQMGWGR